MILVFDYELEQSSEVLSQESQVLVNAERVYLVPMLVENVKVIFEPLYFVGRGLDAFEDAGDPFADLSLVEWLIRVPDHFNR